MNNLFEYLDEYKLLTPKELAYVANGCGPKFGTLGDWVPDFNGLYTPACNLHDWIYWSGGPDSIRNLADLNLKSDMEKINAGLSWWKRWSLAWAPRVYYWVVSYFGAPVYSSSERRKTRIDLKREMEDAGI